MFSIIHWVESLFHLYPVLKLKKKIRCIGISPQIFFPCGFFDGAAAGNIGGAGFVLLLSESHTLDFSLWCGRSTNTRAELLAFWALLAVSKHLGIPLLTIFGDSLFIINWANKNASLDSPCLGHWCNDIRSLMSNFSWLTIKHIYREHNQQVDCLSKKDLVLDPGFGNFTEFLEGMIIDHGNFQLS